MIRGTFLKILAMGVVVGAAQAVCGDSYADEAYREGPVLTNGELAAIEKAKGIFLRENLGWRQYKVSITDEGDMFSVMFWTEENEAKQTYFAPGEDGGDVELVIPSIVGGLVVEISKKGFSVLGKYYTRN